MSVPNLASMVSGEIDDGVPTREELRELRGEVVGGRFMLGDLLRNCSSIVFRATDLVLQRVAAIELLLPPEDHAEYHEWSEVDLMRSTAAVARRLRDHDRARVIDWGTDGEVAYVAIETDDGSDPTELLLAPTPDQSVRVRTVSEGVTSDDGGFEDRPESLLGSGRGVDWGVWKRRARVFGIGTALAGSVGLLLFAGWLGLSDAHADLDPCAGVGQECFTFDGPQPSVLSVEDSDTPSKVRRRAEPDVAPPSSGQTSAEEKRFDDEQDDGTTPAEAADDATQALRKAAAAARAKEEEAAQSKRGRATAERTKKRRRDSRRRARAAERSQGRSGDSVDAVSDEPSPPSVTDLGDPKESDFRRDVFSLPSVDEGDEDTPEGYLANPFSRPSSGS